jgi:hypothetical protein
MAENSVAVVGRGKTFFDGSTPDAAGGLHLEGTVHAFPDSDPDDSTVKRSNGNVVCILVRNKHSAAVLPGTVITWDSTRPHKTTGAPAGGAVGATICAGIVDDHLPSAGAAVDDLFWVIVRGRAKIAYAQGAIGHNDHCFSSGATAAGRVGKVTSPTVAQHLLRIGTGSETIADAGTGDIIVNMPIGPA